MQSFVWRVERKGVEEVTLRHLDRRSQDQTSTLPIPTWLLYLLNQCQLLNQCHQRICISGDRWGLMQPLWSVERKGVEEGTEGTALWGSSVSHDGWWCYCVYFYSLCSTAEDIVSPPDEKRRNDKEMLVGDAGLHWRTYRHMQWGCEPHLN